MKIITESKIEGMSVGDLIKKRFDAIDEWKLALVQRHPVWDSVRIASLLDSLIAGYPIGTLLVCRLKKTSKVLEKEGSTRIAIDAAPGSWQLLDGQQRINALVTLFTDEGEFGRFFINMTMPRKSSIVATTKRQHMTVVEYISWQDDFSANNSFDPKARELFLDLSRWYEWAKSQSEDDFKENLINLRKDPSFCIRILNAVDSDFADSLSDDNIIIAAKRTERLLEVWLDKTIPVQYLTLEDATDILQVFTRSNLEGMSVSGEDVFFASVKTSWNDAEESLDRISGPLIDRMTALRILARISSWATREADLLPLRVDSLNGVEGEFIVDGMNRLAASDNQAYQRIKFLQDELASYSKLGYGLRYIHKYLLDDIFAWAIALPESISTGVIREQRHRIETYLLGAHSFGYPVIFRETYSRMAFLEALSAGMEGKPFPMEKIIDCARQRWPGLASGRQSVQSVKSDSDIERFSYRNHAVFLSLLQNIPLFLPMRNINNSEGDRREIEWDHIFPQALANKMRVWNNDTKRYHAHPERSWIWSAGNLWVLDRPLNNFARASWPSEKMKILENPKEYEAGLPARWPEEENSFLSKEEKATLLEAEQCFIKNDIPNGMRAFKAFAKGRTSRIYRGIKEIFTNLEMFYEKQITDENNTETESIDSSKLAKLLDIPVPEIHNEVTKVIDSDIDRLDRIFLEAKTTGLLDEFHNLIDVSRQLGLYVRPWKKCISLAPQTQHNVALFTIWPGIRGEDYFSILIQPKRICEYFPHISNERIKRMGKHVFGTLKPGVLSEFTSKLKNLFKNPED